MRKKYVVTLTAEERQQLYDLVRKGTVAARMLTRAHILLRADEGATDDAIAQTLHIHRTTVERVRQRFVEGNLDGALHERPRPGGKPTLDMHQQAHLIALAYSAAPEGQATWTMQLLADELVQLGIVETISDETVRRTLKKTFLNPGRSMNG